MRTYIRLIIFTISICCISVEACPASTTQSYLFKNSVLKSQQSEYTPFLLAQQSQDSTVVKNVHSLKLKSPYLAIFYSVIPGIALHGSGHVYAGKIGTGLLLFSSELVGIGLIFIGSVSGGENQEYSSGRDNALFIGTALFIGSWVYDIFGAPVAVQKRNQKLLQNSNTELKFQLKDKDLRLAIVWHF
jgi:hypothetical protein